MFKKILFRSRAGWFGDSSKIDISEFKRNSGLEIPAKMIFQNSNETIIEEMKKKLAPLSEEYN